MTPQHQKLQVVALSRQPLPASGTPPAGLARGVLPWVVEASALAVANHRSHGELNGIRQHVEVEGAIMAHAVNEEGRRAIDAAADAAHKMLTHARRIDMPGDLAGKAGDIEAETGRILDQMVALKGILMLEQQIVHVPELALYSGRLCGFCRVLSMRVDHGQREVTKDAAQAGAQELSQVLDHAMLGTTEALCLFSFALYEAFWWPLLRWNLWQGIGIDLHQHLQDFFAVPPLFLTDTPEPLGDLGIVCSARCIASRRSAYERFSSSRFMRSASQAFLAPFGVTETCGTFPPSARSLSRSHSR
jgi:hypothetical protein